MNYWIPYAELAPPDNSEIWVWDGLDVHSASFVQSGVDDAGDDEFYCTKEDGSEVEIIFWILRNEGEPMPSTPKV